MKRSLSVVIGLILLTGLVWGVMAGRETAVIHYSQASKSIASAASEAVDAQNIELLSQMGGSASVVTINESYAYVGMGPRLAIFDILTNQPTPLLVGQTDILSGDVMAVAVSGDYAYVAVYDGAANSPLFIIDISNASEPVLIGSYETPGSVENLAVSGTYAYIADGEYGLRILDISDPDNLSEVGFYDTPDHAFDIVLNGNTAYIADKSGLRIIDITNSASPIESGFFTFPTSAWARNLTISNDYIYSGVGNDLFIVDVSDPENPAQVGLYAALGISDVAVKGDYAYIVGHCALEIVDISDPTSPQLADIYGRRAATWALALAADYAYVANSWAGLDVISIANPLIPTSVSSYAAQPGNAYALDVANGFAYVLNGVGDFCSANLQIMDVSNLANPIAKGSYTSFGGMKTVDVSGTAAYVIASSGEILVLDVSDPANPTEVNDIFLPGAVKDLVVVDNLAYIVDSTGFRILDVSDPLNDIELGSLTDVFEDSKVTVQDEYAYIAHADGLSIINVLDPVHPDEIGTYNNTAWSYVSGVDVVNEYVYVAIGWNNGYLRAVDVSDPTDPVEVGAVVTSGTLTGVVAVDDLAYVADGRSGLRAFNISAPASMVEIGYFDTPGFAYDLSVVDDVVYLADSGLFSLEFVAASSTVTSELGGTLIFTDTQNLPTTIQVPSGAVTDTTTLVFTPLATATDSSGLTFAGHAFDLIAYQNGLEQQDFIFQQPVTVTIHYSDADIANIDDETQLMLMYWGDNDWVDAATTCIPESVYGRDTINNVLSVPICHLNRYALFGADAQKVYLPIVVR